MSKNLLLISNSKSYGKGYLDHCAEEIVDFLGDIKEISFIPYALHDWDRYESIVKKRFHQLGINLRSIHHDQNPKKTILKAAGLFIGGGNTFRLLHQLYKHDLIAIIKKRVTEGLRYIGASAGANVACPTIKTTNDMPIIQPPSLNALGLVSFQINPHYVDADPTSTHQGETREQRLNEFHEENDTVVVGLKEGAWLRIENDTVYLKGRNGGRIFRQGKKPRNFKLTGGKPVHIRPPFSPP